MKPQYEDRIRQLAEIYANCRVGKVTSVVNVNEWYLSYDGFLDAATHPLISKYILNDYLEKQQDNINKIRTPDHKFDEKDELISNTIDTTFKYLFDGCEIIEE